MVSCLLLRSIGSLGRRKLVSALPVPVRLVKKIIKVENLIDQVFHSKPVRKRSRVRKRPHQLSRERLVSLDLLNDCLGLRDYPDFRIAGATADQRQGKNH